LRITTTQLIDLKPRSFSNFVEFIKKNNFESAAKSLVEICVPNSYAINGNTIADINKEKCTGCLLCLEKSDRVYVNKNDSLTNVKNKDNISLKEIASQCFKGKYINCFFTSKLSAHSSKNETKITNLMGALYLLYLSKKPKSTFFCSSPNWELSIYTETKGDEREGHLDIVVYSSEKLDLFILEGKNCVKSLLDSRNRDQLQRYEKGVSGLLENVTCDVFYSFLIGGNESALYPSGIGPHNNLKDNFFTFIEKNNAKFISIEALRALKAYNMEIDNNFCWEDDLKPLFLNHNFYGLVSGGIICKVNSKFKLLKAPWII